MMHKAWCNIEEEPYFFEVIHEISRSHGLPNLRFESNLSKITRLVAASKSLRFPCSYTNKWSANWNNKNDVLYVSFVALDMNLKCPRYIKMTQQNHFGRNFNIPSFMMILWFWHVPRCSLVIRHPLSQSPTCLAVFTKNNSIQALVNISQKVPDDFPLEKL